MDFHPQARLRLLRWILLFVVLAAAVAGIARWRNNQPAKQPQPVASTPSRSAATIPAAFNKSQYSINDPASVWAVIDKGRALPSDYLPANLATPNVALRLAVGNPEMSVRKDTAVAMEKLFAAATSDSRHLMLASGYRSYTEQVSVYNAEVQKSGRSGADLVSARPGHSEHQTGLAADLEPTSRSCELDVCFADTIEGKWLAANAYKYGFIIRYQKDKTSQTGYAYEPWHIRYIGVDLAGEINKTGQTLEQFFGLPAHPDYPATIHQLKAGY